VNVFCTRSKERVYGLFFVETTITIIVYLDMLQQLLIAQMNMAKKDTITSSKTAHPLITLEKYLITHLPG
jgi:hypothetical protein